MQSLKVKAKIDVNGKLNIQLPQELANQEINIVLVYQPVIEEKLDNIHKVVDSFYGCLESDPILHNL